MKFRNFISHKNVLLPVCIIAVVVLMAGVVFAYLTDQAYKQNAISIGSQTSRVEEEWNPPDEILEGSDYSKVVAVMNTGTVDCYVRVLAEFETPEMADAITIDYDTTNWSSKQADGYYYYNSIVKSGDTTKPLFTKLHANAALDSLSIIVYEETVQAEGFDNAKAAFAAYQ